MDVHVVHSGCSAYEAFWPDIFVAFRVFVAFMGHRGWTLEAFDSICGIYGALALYVSHLGLV